MDWLNATAAPGGSGVLAQRSVARAALDVLEDAVRTWGCTAVLSDYAEWRERWDFSTDQASRAGLLSSGDPEERRRQLAEMERDASISDRRLVLWEMDLRPNGRAGYVDATSTARECDLVERAVAFARRSLPAYIARNVPRPVTVQWFTERANEFIDPVFWAVPHLRGAVVDHPRDGTMRVRVGQGDDQLVETVAHELFHMGQPRSAGVEHHEMQERDAHEFGRSVLADWQANTGVVDLSVRRRSR